MDVKRIKKLAATLNGLEQAREVLKTHDIYEASINLKTHDIDEASINLSDRHSYATIYTENLKCHVVRWLNEEIESLKGEIRREVST